MRLARHGPLPDHEHITHSHDHHVKFTCRVLLRQPVSTSALRGYEELASTLGGVTSPLTASKVAHRGELYGLRKTCQSSSRSGRRSSGARLGLNVHVAGARATVASVASYASDALVAEDFMAGASGHCSQLQASFRARLLPDANARHLLDCDCSVPRHFGLGLRLSAAEHKLNERCKTY